MSCQKCKAALVVAPEGLRVVGGGAPQADRNLDLPPSSLGDAGSGSVLMDFIMFRSMITPTLLKIFFWLGCVGIVLLGLAMMVAPLFTGQIQAILFGLIFGPVFVVLGLIQLRVTTEIMLVVFKFFSSYDTLADIRKELERMNRQ